MTQKKNSTGIADKPLVNRVAQSGIVTFVLEEFAPKSPMAFFDLSDYLWQGFVLKEKEFRAALGAHEWENYADHILCVYCSTDAIIPTWAYMLVASRATGHAERVFLGNRDAFLTVWFEEVIDRLDAQSYEDARIVVKGCGGDNVPESAYVALVRKLQPVAKSLMFGEPCSTVPLFKRPKI